MSTSRFDKYFGGARGDAEKALQAMKKTYGSKKGKIVFDATITKRERKAKRGRK